MSHAPCIFPDRLHRLDRLSSNQVAITQERIASNLGVRREGVTDAAGKLHELDIIRYTRGKITVLDRSELEQMCCECYAVVKKETDRLLSFPTANRAGDLVTGEVRPM